MKRGDFLIIALVAAGILLLWLTARADSDGADAVTAEIIIDGEFYKSVKITQLRQELVLVSARGISVLLIQDGAVSMARADCPSQDCVKSGAHRAAGDFIACLPNRILVRLTGDGGAPDGIAY
ncbi:MAG: NusG domain II-containing protein [Oscillospiraceae bacterium]|jgi:hypothetical protein|nr:NusG domain II-containing protein [Oscillospiraceae bacterium]